MPQAAPPEPDDRDQPLRAMPAAAMQRLAASVQPVVFETGVPAAPYSTIGTAFYVGCGGRAFAVMARHTLRPDSLHPLCLFPTGGSHRLLPLTNVFYVPAEHEGDESVDLAIVEIDMPVAMADGELGQAVLLDMNLAVPSQRPPLSKSSLVVIGYPAELSSVDYEAEELRNERFALRGRYVEATMTHHVHELRVVDEHRLDSFSGLSGAPVFAWHQSDERTGRVFLCGMAIQGTVCSGLIRFLDAQIIVQAIHVMVSR